MLYRPAHLGVGWFVATVFVCLLVCDVSTLSQTEPPPCGYCADLHINKIKKCKANVLSKKGKGCVFDWLVENAACDKVKEQEGTDVKASCNDGCSCVDKVDIDGEDTYTTIVKHTEGKCTYVIEITVTYEGKGWRGTCKKDE